MASVARWVPADVIVRQVSERVAVLRVSRAPHPKAARHEAPECCRAVEAQLHLEALDANA